LGVQIPPGAPSGLKNTNFENTKNDIYLTQILNCKF